MKGLDKIAHLLPAEATLYAYSACTDYQLEDQSLQRDGPDIKVQRKCNFKRSESKELNGKTNEEKSKDYSLQLYIW